MLAEAVGDQTASPEGAGGRRRLLGNPSLHLCVSASLRFIVFFFFLTNC